jgi:hypothetical protein
VCHRKDIYVQLSDNSNVVPTDSSNILFLIL